MSWWRKKSLQRNTWDVALGGRGAAPPRPGLQIGSHRLPDMTVAFDAAFRSEVVEVHLSHERDDTVLACKCRAAGLRAAVDTTLARVLAMRQPRSIAEERAAIAHLRSGRQNPARETSTDLMVLGDADPLLMVEVPPRAASL